MLILNSDLKDTTGLTFSPDGQSLLAVANDNVQVWSRWLDLPPRHVAKAPASLERYAFAPDGKKVYLYKSGNSRTDVLNVATGKVTKTPIPGGGPAWLSFNSEGGFVLASHDEGKLTRFDFDPKLKNKFRKSWSIERETTTTTIRAIGSHYAFGAICEPAGVFVALEYRYGDSEPLDGLVVRSITDGAKLYHKRLTSNQGHELLRHAGLKLAIHPSGRYFAYPKETGVCLSRLAPKVKLPAELKNVDLPTPPAPALAPAPTKGKKRKKLPKPVVPECKGVAFHPSGSLLAVVGNDGTVKLFDTATWKLNRTLDWALGPLHAVCFTPDGTRAAAISSAGKVVVWDVDL